MNRKNIFLSCTILCAGLFFTFGIVAFAQDFPGGGPRTGGGPSIRYPVKDLGGCKNKKDCKRYCDDPANMPRCIEFAEKQGMMSSEEASQKRQLTSKILGGGGPGGCKTPQACKAFCEDLRNLDQCVSFVEREGIQDKSFEEAKKISSYLKSGKEMPGGCTSRQSCEEYCSDFSHGDECLEYIEGAGLDLKSEDSDDGEDKGPQTAAQFRQFLEVAKQGQAPGGCSSKASCQAYCMNPDHIEECLSFGERLGFVKPEEAAMARKTGGRGPGGCTSQDSCDEFCSDPAHAKECFEFGQRHGLISEEERADMEEGMTQIRDDLDMASPEVLSCVTSALGPGVLEEIKSGSFFPGPGIGETFQACFGEFREDSFETLENAPLREQFPEGDFGPGGEGFQGEEGDFPEDMKMPFRPDPSQFRSENEATPFFGQDRGVPNPQDPIIKERLRKELEGRGLDPSQFEGVFNRERGFGKDGQGGFDPERFRETIQRAKEERGFQDVQGQMEQGFRQQMEEQMRGGFQGPPPGFDGGFQGPPPGDGGGQQGGNLFRAVRNILFVLGSD